MNYAPFLDQDSGKLSETICGENIENMRPAVIYCDGNTTAQAFALRVKQTGSVNLPYELCLSLIHRNADITRHFS